MAASRISVIMGIYNCAPTLGEALDSLLDQTYQDFKVILCDDGSKDNTYQIASEYALKYPGKFILLRNDRNRGLNYTLNHCLRYADTEYVARMDGDDISLPERFEKEIAYLDFHPEMDIVSCGMIYFDENGDFGNCITKPHNPSPRNFAFGTPFCHAPCMVRKRAYDAVGGYSESPRLLRVEDYHLWVKMYAKGFRGHVLGEALYKMRDDRNATIRRTWKNRLNEAYVKYLAFKLLPIPKRLSYQILRPIVISMLPNFVYDGLHKRRVKTLTT